MSKDIYVNPEVFSSEYFNIFESYHGSTINWIKYGAWKESQAVDMIKSFNNTEDEEFTLLLYLAKYAKSGEGNTTLRCALEENIINKFLNIESENGNVLCESMMDNILDFISANPEQHSYFNNFIDKSKKGFANSIDEYQVAISYAIRGDDPSL